MKARHWRRVAVFGVLLAAASQASLLAAGPPIKTGTVSGYGQDAVYFDAANDAVDEAETKFDQIKAAAVVLGWEARETSRITLELPPYDRPEFHVRCYIHYEIVDPNVPDPDPDPEPEPDPPMP